MQDETVGINKPEKLHFVLTMTSPASPEQYDVFLGLSQVGYLRFRHGHFWVHYPDVKGKRVYTAKLSEDFDHGAFSKEERDTQLTLALDAIVDALIKDKSSDFEHRPAFDYEIDDDEVQEDFNYQKKPFTMAGRVRAFIYRIRNRSVNFNDLNFSDLDLTEAERDSNDRGPR
ncbi:MAG: hypothetical protein SOI66_03240 [Bifidobacterium sp.]|jgi:hypothetical protein